jgi:carboxyl-terminal processing protease
MSRWNLAWLVGITAAALLGLSITYSAPSRQVGLQKKHENLKLLVDVLEEVQHRYVRELDQDKMRELVENMINGGLERLDPHSGYINAKEFKQFQTSSRGKFGGVGIKLGLHPKSGALLVDSPMVGTPAYEAGVLAGDIIVKIDDKSTETVGLKEAVELIQGEPGTKIKLTVVHAGQKKLIDLEMTRAEIVIHSVMGDVRKAGNLKDWDFMIDKENKLAYIRLTAFTETSTKELTEVVEELQREGVKGIVLDLRTNPGGLLKAAVEISNMFLPEGKRIVSTKGRNHRDEIYDALRRGSVMPSAAQCPVAILINRYSASASEIVSACLQDHGRAIVVGERSYGKGSVQNIIKMENGASALKLTTASYWRPSGRNIHHFPDAKDFEAAGIDPDEWGVLPSGCKLTTAVIELGKFLSADEMNKYKAKLLYHAERDYKVTLTDEDRAAYMNWRSERDVVRGPNKDEKKDDKPFVDPVLRKAVDYLKGEIEKEGAAAPAAPAGRDA